MTTNIWGMPTWFSFLESLNILKFVDTSLFSLLLHSWQHFLANAQAALCKYYNSFYQRLPKIYTNLYEIEMELHLFNLEARNPFQTRLCSQTWRDDCHIDDLSVHCDFHTDVVLLNWRTKKKNHMISQFKDPSFLWFFTQGNM